jgi:hypothetical protein
VIHEQEWADSVLEAFGACDTVRHALSVHYDECAKIANGLPPDLLSLLRACLPLHYPFRLQALSLQKSSRSSSSSELPTLVRLDPRLDSADEVEQEEDLGVEVDGEMSLF